MSEKWEEGSSFDDSGGAEEIDLLWVRDDKEPKKWKHTWVVFDPE